VSIKRLAVMYADALGLGKPARAIKCDPVASGKFCRALKSAGVPGWLAEGITTTHTDFWAPGKLDYASSPAVLALHPPEQWRTMEQWVAEHAPLVQFTDQASV
jgi:hypothetical protein